MSTSFRSRGPITGAGLGKRRQVPESYTSADEADTLSEMEDADSRAEETLLLSKLAPKIKARRKKIKQAEKDKDLVRRESLLPTNPFLISDKAIMQSMVELDYRAYRQKNPGIRSIIEKIASFTSEITEGFPVTFLDVAEDERGLYPRFRTPDGDLPLNVLSQGTQSIMQFLAYLLLGFAKYYDYPPDIEKKPGIFIVDEIDAHLHPSWQRRILPTLRKTFPNLQVFCSTHSPLMLAGLKVGQIHLLNRTAKGAISISRNQVDIEGWSADEIMRCFMDVKDPTDLQTATQVRKLAELRKRKTLSPNESKELRRTQDDLAIRLLGSNNAERLDLLKKRIFHAKVNA